MTCARAPHNVAAPEHAPKYVSDGTIVAAVDGDPELLSQRQGGHAVRVSPEQFENWGAALSRRAPSLLGTAEQTRRVPR